LCIFCCCGSLAAQRVEPFKGRNGKYGLVKIINEFEKEIVVKPKYDYFNSFDYFCTMNPNITEVKLGNKWGFINKNGKEITPIKYDSCRAFTNGFATVKLNGKWGYVDTNGKEKIFLGNYDDIGNPWIFLVDYDIWQYSTERTLSNLFIGNLIVIKINEKFGLMDTNENIVVPCKYDKISQSACNLTDIFDNFVIVRIDDKWGMINNKGEEFLPVIYDEINTDWESDSIFIVELDGKQGIIDFNGKEVAALKWDYCSPSSNGTTIVELNGKEGLIENYTEKEIIPTKYDNMAWGINNLFRVKLNEKYGVIDISEKVIIPIQYTDMRAYVIEDDLLRIRVELDGKWGVMDTNGKEIIPIKYDDISYCWLKDRDWLSVRLNDKWGIIDNKTGEEVIPIKYDEEIHFGSENYAKVELNGKFGIVDTAGEELLPPKCENLYYCIDAYSILVKCDTVLYFLDKATEKVIAAIILDDYYSYRQLFSNDIAIKTNGKWGVVNNRGEEIIPYKYKKLSQLRAKLMKMKNKK